VAAALVAERLPAFLGRASRTRFAYGTHDCLIWLADWLIELGYPDCGSAWRGAYRDAEGATELLVRFGGHRALIRAGLDGCLTQTDHEQPGAIGVVRIGDLHGCAVEAGAIRTGIGWAVLAPRGLRVSTRAVALAAWAV
jgi:hypothetical protein